MVSFWILRAKLRLYRGIPPHLHRHHFRLALRAEDPLIGQVVVVVGAQVAVQRDRVLRQLDDLYAVQTDSI